jgi:hypothetical protein
MYIDGPVIHIQISKISRIIYSPRRNFVSSKLETVELLLFRLFPPPIFPKQPNINFNLFCCTLPYFYSDFSYDAISVPDFQGICALKIKEEHPIKISKLANTQRRLPLLCGYWRWKTSSSDVFEVINEYRIRNSM